MNVPTKCRECGKPFVPNDNGQLVVFELDMHGKKYYFCAANPPLKETDCVMIWNQKYQHALAEDIVQRVQ